MQRGVTAFCKEWIFVLTSGENVLDIKSPMDPSPTIDLAGLCLVIVMHAGILALRLGISLAKA